MDRIEHSKLKKDKKKKVKEEETADDEKQKKEKKEKKDKKKKEETIVLTPDHFLKLEKLADHLNEAIKSLSEGTS